MFAQIAVVGRGRLGSTVAARLAERGLLAEGERGDLVLLCVPDRVIHEKAATIPVGPWLAETLGLQPFDLQEDRRVLYHAGATMASNFLVTLYRAARQLVETAGVPSEALLPLMRRTIDNGFELTGPIARGDWSTVDAHLAAIRKDAPDVEELYRAMTRATRP